MLRSILPNPTYDHLFSLDGDEGGEGGGGSSGSSGSGGEGGTPPAGDESGKSSEGDKDTLTEKQFNKRMSDRVMDAKRTTTEAIAKELGVSIEEAKRLVAAAKATEDAEKSDATKAREAADTEKAAAEVEKTEAAQAKHDAKVEREILRHVKIADDMDDDAIDKKVSRLARLIDVEVGADAETIKIAVNALKDEEPLMFGVTEDNGGETGGKPAATGDPKGTPPKKTGTEGAFERGQKRAAERSGPDQYPILTGTAPPPT